MTKKELVKQILDNHNKCIYGAPLVILEIYTDDEEVDEVICEMLLTPPSPPPVIEIFMGHEANKKFDELFKDYIKDENNKH